MNNWNAALYLKYERERTQPSIDLAARILLENPAKVIDLGCGPGNSTRVLRDRFPGARVVGADFSENMVEAARKAYPDMDFIRCDLSSEIGSLETGWDVVFSNACIQWVPDHARLLPEMMGLLAPGGVMAIQVPINQIEPVHHLIAETAASVRWRALLRDERIFHTLSVREYHDILSGLTDEPELWETAYQHIMESHEAILEWYRGTGLRPWLKQLPEEQRPEFERDILSGLRDRYPVQRNGKILFRFPRLFMMARA